MPEALHPRTHTARNSAYRTVAFATVLGVLLASCHSSQYQNSSKANIAQARTEIHLPRVEVSVTDGESDVSPAQPITLTTQEGSIESATLIGSDGRIVKTELSADKTRWRSGELLAYGKRYALHAKVKGAHGESSVQRTFTTTAPLALTMPYFNTGNSRGSVVGVAQPVGVKFDEPIADRAAAENAITIKTQPPVEGAFYWISPTEVRWRPERFWQPGTQVSVLVNDYGVHFGNHMYGQQDIVTNFTIGDDVLAVADDATKQVQVYVNGELVKTMPTSMGRNDMPTNNGYYTVGDRNESMIMDSSTYGLPTWAPLGYRLSVGWATQISYSGIYVHAAPWSVWAQGSTNTSHGCLNVSPENAKWFLQHVKRGDVVLVKNTVGTTLPGNDGLGDWNIPWEVWKAGNRNAT